ncbi:Hsp70 family protein [Prescottella subtropica]|uniref:Hsp70 family protein n=1 Tax=Prescottella subtropica TaxID=2545757 RepID=UPI001F4F89AE|nr:Hsp70 family protein [Prescottella subtropica]
MSDSAVTSVRTTDGPGFLDRVGDPVGVLDDTGRTRPGEDLFADTVAGLVAAVEPSGPAGAVVVTHPAGWSSYTAGALEAALGRRGPGHTSLIPDALACTAWLDAVHGPLGDGAVVVYDVGASGLTVTVVRTGDEPSILGRSLHSDEFGGDRIDHLVTRHILGSVAGKLDGLDTSDPATTAALADLRRRCRDAKESLSTDTETVVAVALPGFETSVRLVRSEFEDLVREPLSRSLGLIREALYTTNIGLSDVGDVLIVGGGAAIPLVAELVAAEFGSTVTVAPRPVLTAALGAAHLARDRATVTAPTATVVVDDLPTSEYPVAAPVSAGFPTRRNERRRGWSTQRRLAVATSAAAAVAVLAAGGLALGTASNPVPAQSPSSVENAPVAGTTPAGDGTPAGPGGDATAVTVGRGGAAAPTVVDAATGRTVPAGTPARRGTASVPAPGTPDTPEVPGVPALPDPPAAPNLPAAPADPPPAYTPPPGPDAGQIGTGIGNAATGIGNGLGGVVTGIGNGLGGVVNGLGGVVGAVVDPVTGLLIGQ